jgi:hypothetical protein
VLHVGRRISFSFSLFFPLYLSICDCQIMIESRRQSTYYKKELLKTLTSIKEILTFSEREKITERFASSTIACLNAKATSNCILWSR